MATIRKLPSGKWNVMIRKKGFPFVSRTFTTLEEANYWNENFKYTKEVVKNKSAYRLLWLAKKRAKQKRIEFNLNKDDLILPKYCPYLEIEIQYNEGHGRLPNNPSLDRIDPSKGYVKGNVEVISYKANAMKQNATREELLLFARRIQNWFNPN